MLLPVNASLGTNMRYSRLGASRHSGATGIKTISIPVAQTAMPAPLPPPPKVEVQEAEEAADDSSIAGETPIDAELAEEERKARKAAAAREKRKRKKQANKAAQATTVSSPAELEADVDDDEDPLVTPPQELASVGGTLPPTPASPLHIGANLTDSGTASSDGKASGVSTPASSHGFSAPQRTLDWASLEENGEEVSMPTFEDGRKSSMSINKDESASRIPLGERLSSDPSITPRVGRFWSHDERGLDGRWKGRASPAFDDRSGSPYAGSSDGGWQEVTKHQPRLVRPSDKAGKVKAAPPKSNWGKGNYTAPIASTSSGMRAWADEDQDVFQTKPERPAQAASVSPAPTASPAELASRPPEPPWTARSPVPFLFNAPGSRYYVEDVSRKRIMQLRIHVNSRSGRTVPRTSERSLVLTYRLPAQRHPHPLAEIPSNLVVRCSAGRGAVRVSHPAAERKRRAEDQLARAAKEAADQAELEQAKLEAERRLLLEAEVRAARAAQEAAESAERERVEEEQRRLVAARQMLMAAMPQPLPEEAQNEPVQPVASTSTAAQSASPAPAPSPAQQQSDVEQTTMPEAAEAQYSGAPPPQMQSAASMFPPGPFVFAEGMGPPGVHIFDPNLGMVVPIDPAAAAQFFPPPPLMDNGAPQSPADLYAAPASQAALQPAFFAPARSSKIEIKAPAPGQPAATRSYRRQTSAGLRNFAHSPTASRQEAPTPTETPVEEHMIPGSYVQGGAVYFSAPPSQSGFYFPAPGPGEFFAPPQSGGSDFVDPAILSLGAVAA